VASFPDDHLAFGSALSLCAGTYFGMQYRTNLDAKPVVVALDQEWKFKFSGLVNAVGKGDRVIRV
jgi:hypothetical protein